jgi:23S rRNA (uracil1939-C5)-methyltransferase
MKIDLDILSIGGMGDGIARYQGKTVFVPFATTGDKLVAQITPDQKDFYQAHIVELTQAGSSRQAAPCIHFTKCGGCTMQHIKPLNYNIFKRDILLQAVKRLNCDESVVTALIQVGPHSRRRAEFKVTVNKGHISIGFFEAKSHNIVDVTMCPVTTSEIVDLLPKLRHALHDLKKPGNIKSTNISLADNGIDMLLNTTAPTTANDKAALIAFAKENGIIRLAEKATEIDILYNKESPLILLGDVEVELPTGSFMQATAIGQKAITDIILKNTEGHKRIIDLYCGIGTYSFPLVQTGHTVKAYEGGNEMVTAIHNAARRNNIEDKISAGVRDLIKRPVKPHELKDFDAVVINPPRNGAKPQAEEIAKSEIKKVVMVSCNPATFERDAKCLLDGGFGLNSATPIDQFYWNAHLELVAVFSR